MNNIKTLTEYAVIGGGPAAICAIAKLYSYGIPGNKIIWVDPQFKVGDFGTKLSTGSSVPGNTTVASYQKVNNAIYTAIPACVPTVEQKIKFEITVLSPNTTCSLRVATQPLQHITETLRKLVYSIKGIVHAVYTTKDGIRLDIKTNDIISNVMVKRVILAIGASPKTIKLPDYITIIDPYTVFVKSELKQYLDKNPNITTVAVIGSSHSAALATMHLVQAGIHVKQFMNKEYKFAMPAIAPDGTRYIQYDNTGLKGEVATFTRQLLHDKKTDKTKYAQLWEYYIEKNIEALLSTRLSKCTHAVICIGYTPSSSLQINGLSISTFKYNKYSTQIIHADGRPVTRIFGIGIAYPTEVIATSGEIEFAVGVEKFWNSINDATLHKWIS